MVKNIVVSALYKVPGHNFEYYKKLEEYSSKTYKKFMKNVDEFILFTGEKKNHQEMFYDIFLKTWNLWKSEKCNIFFHDIDSLCLKDLDIFSNNFDNFRVFNFAVAPNLKEINVNVFFSDASRYFSSKMNEELWILGNNLWKKHIHDTNIWNTQQRIYNKIFQHPLNNMKIPTNYINIVEYDLSKFNHNIDFLQPEYNLIQHPMCKFFKQINIEDAYIIQFCGSIKKKSDGTDFIQYILKDYSDNYDLEKLKKNIIQLFNVEWTGAFKRYGHSSY